VFSRLTSRAQLYWKNSSGRVGLPAHSAGPAGAQANWAQAAPPARAAEVVVIAPELAEKVLRETPEERAQTQVMICDPCYRTTTHRRIGRTRSACLG
jgi:hypothetical protein